MENVFMENLLMSGYGCLVWALGIKKVEETLTEIKLCCYISSAVSWANLTVK